MGILFKRISDALKNFTWDIDEIYLGTEIETNKVPKLGDFPENDDKTIGLIDGEASVISNYIPTLGTVVTFDAPRSYGNWKTPRTDLTISFLNAQPVQKAIFFIESATIPSDIDPSQNYMLPISGDTFNTTAGFVNKLEITRTLEDSPQNNLIHIHNTAVNISLIGGDTSLLAFYKFEEVSDDYDFIFDETGYNNHGEINAPGNATRITGSIGNAAQLSLQGTRFVVPHHSSMALTNQMTFACYVSLAAANFGSRLGIASKDADSDGVGTIGGWYITRETSGKLRFNINGNSSYQIDSVYDYTTGDVVIHLAVTYNAGVLKIYINKVLNATDTNADLAIINGNQPLFIGGVQKSGFANANLRTGGTIDEVRYYNIALDDAQIAALP